MRFLRTNTAVIITVGPFYDKTDGVTIETGLTITNERITLTADTDAGSAPTNILDNIAGATSGTANDLDYIAGNDAGMMKLELAAADVNRVGRMLLSITDAANHVPVFHEFMVLPAAIYDWFILGSIVPLPANMTQILGTAVSTPATAGILDINVKNWINTAAATPTVAGVPEVDVTHWIGTAAATPTVAGVPEVDVTHWRGAAVPAPATAGTPAVNATEVGGQSQTAGDVITQIALNTTLIGLLPSAATITTAVFARAFSAAYSSLTFDEMIKLMAAALLAKCSGMGTATGTFRNLADSADTIVATIDASGNRTAVVRTP